MTHWGSLVVVCLSGALWTAACGGSDDEAKGAGGSSGGNAGNGGSLVGGSGGVVSGGGSGGTTSGGGTGGNAGDAGKCGPTDPGASWKPIPYKSAKTKLGSCTTGMISEYFAKCMASNEAPCAAFGASSDTAKATCESCLWSKLEDPTWSAFVTFSKDHAVVSAWGCVELLGGEGAAECAAALSDSEQCVYEACKACPATSGLDQTCVDKAQQGVCKTYSDPAPKACQPFGASYCLKGDIPSAEKVAAVFCGPGAPDAGSDASADASQD